MIRQTLLIACLALPTLTAARGGVVYDSTNTGNQGINTGSQAQFANEVTALAGAPLSVTELDLGFTSQGVAATADLQAFLYANDGTNGAPGTLLWQSAVMRGVAINSTNVLISFAVPSILVPQTFSFAAAITNASPLVGFVPSSSTKTGTYKNAFAGSPGSWQSLSSVYQVEARIITAAVPEPASMVLLGVGLIGVLGVRNRRASTAR